MKLGYAYFSTTDQALAIPSCVRINASSLAISLKKENPSAKLPEPSMSMSQQSIAAYTTIRPYDSTPFRSHAWFEFLSGALQWLVSRSTML